MEKSKPGKGKKRKLSSENTTSVTGNTKGHKKEVKDHIVSSVVDSEHFPKKKKMKGNRDSTTTNSHTYFTDESANKDTFPLKHKKKHAKAKIKDALNSIDEHSSFKENERNLKKQKKNVFEPESFPRRKKLKKSQEFRSNSSFESFNKNNSSSSSITDVNSSTGKHTNFKGAKNHAQKQNENSFEPKSFPWKKNYSDSQEFQSNANSKSFNKRHQSNDKFNNKVNVSSKTSMFESGSPFRDNLDSNKMVGDVDTSGDSTKGTTSKKLKKKNKKQTKKGDVSSSHIVFNEKKQSESNFAAKPKEKIAAKQTIDSNQSNSKRKLEAKLLSEDFIPLNVSKPEDPAEKTERTVFVGNLPKTVQKKELLKMFNPFGSIQSMRLRGAIPRKETISKKVAGKTGKYHEAIHSIKAYIVFEEQKSAKKALVLNGSLLNGRHIVVDAAANSTEKSYEDKRSIFIGNLPYDVDDEAVWTAFDNCGKIDRVRIIRDCVTGVGKGFGYVSFSSTQAKENALSLEGVQISGRTIRIKAVESKQQMEKQNNNRREFHHFKQHALKIKKEKSENSNCRKSTKKIMKLQKKIAKKKKIAQIFGNV
ncbi:RNA-binding protein 34-like isoform X2 [Uloborus diversus]|nr:RNA-binding protein 34-like isoform X2 [Uloborus diversus]